MDVRDIQGGLRSTKISFPSQSMPLPFRWDKKLTLLMKSAASTDQPRQMSLSLIWICLDNMWSLISFLDLPMYGLCENQKSQSQFKTNSILNIKSSLSSQRWNKISTYTTKHAFKGHYANGKKVYWSCVILSAHDFGCHVARRTRCVLSVLLTPDTRNTKSVILT